MEKHQILGVAIYPALVIITLIVGLSCGPNPPFAPFGSTIEINPAIEDISLEDPLALEPLQVESHVFGPDGLPLNDVRVRFDLSFAEQNSFIVDTNGDELPDARLLQLVDPNKCKPDPCDSTPISQWFQQGAFVDSPYTKLTDNRGVARLIILISGSAVADPASLTASLENGDPPAVDDFSVNAQSVPTPTPSPTP